MDTFSSPPEGIAYYTSAQKVGSEASIQIFKTSTKGASWAPLTSISSGHALKNFGGQVQASYFDSQHLWLTVREATSVAFSFADLFSTVDGGESWQLLPSPPVFGQLQFISPTIGFLLGGFEDSELYRTSDGGQSWSRVGFAEGKNPEREIEVSLSLPRFESELNGSLIVSVVKEGVVVTIAYRTTDGGATWLKTNIRSLASAQPTKVGTDTPDPLVIQVQAGINVYTSHVSGKAKIFKLPKAFHNAVISHASFKGDQVGWIVVHSGLSDALMLTKDGGESYVDVTPPSLRSETSSALGTQENLQSAALSDQPTPEVLNPPLQPVPFMAWDQQVAPRYDQLDDWGFTSSFHGVGIYMGGSNFSPAQLAKSNLNPLYSFKLACDFFAIIPLWVGPQANTARFHSSLIFPNPNAAYSQGYKEGQSAVTAAYVELGLSSGIIYYNVEGYDEPTSLSVGTFVSGWTHALHDLGWKSGVYFAAKNWREMVLLSAEPDDIWVASINLSGSPSGGVYGLSPLPDSLWIYNQRLRQYAINAPAFIGVHSELIDYDLVAGDTTWADIPIYNAADPAAYACDAAHSPNLQDSCSPGSATYFYDNPVCGQTVDCNGADPGVLNGSPCTQSSPPSSSGCSDVCDSNCSNYDEVTCDCYYQPVLNPMCNSVCPQYDPGQCVDPLGNDI